MIIFRAISRMRLDFAFSLEHFVELVMAGPGTPLRLRSGDPVVPAIHDLVEATRRGCPRAQTSLRSLRKLDCVARA
jgi:hypothetical protein